MNIDSGAADAVAVDIGVAKYQLAQREEVNIRSLTSRFRANSTVLDLPKETRSFVIPYGPRL